MDTTNAGRRCRSRCHREHLRRVASHPLFACLFKEISAKYPVLAALVLEITKVARAAVATSQYTTTPGEQREESLQDLRKAANKSASAEEAMRKHEKEARGGEENPGGPSPKNSGAGRKKDRGVRRTHSSSERGGGHAGRTGARSRSSPGQSND